MRFVIGALLLVPVLTIGTFQGLFSVCVKLVPFLTWLLETALVLNLSGT